MKQQTRLSTLSLVSLILLVACTGEQASERDAAPSVADLVFTNGYIYTVDTERTVAQAVAVQAGNIVHVGSNESVQGYVGAGTKIHDLGGRLMLPGLHDMHVHATGLAEPSLCNLEGDVKPMEKLVPFVKDCLERERIPAGEWLVPGGKWLTWTHRRVSSANCCSRCFQARARYPLLPPASAVMNKSRASG